MAATAFRGIFRTPALLIVLPKKKFWLCSPVSLSR